MINGKWLPVPDVDQPQSHTPAWAEEMHREKRTMRVNLSMFVAAREMKL